MSLKKYFFKSKFTYRIYLYYNLLIRHKSFLNRSQYSQWGEDFFINNFFKDQEQGIYFDVGCYHPFMYSNTFLLYKKGWKGINIDINPTAIDLFNIARPKDFNLCTTIDENKREFKVFFDDHFSPVNTLNENYYKTFREKYFRNTSFKKVQSKSIDEILKKSEFTNINFLNIDVEGMDLVILQQMVPDKIKPNLISIETHNVDGTKSVDCDKISTFLHECNYKIYKRIGPTTLFNS